MAQVCYCTREQVQAAIDAASSVRLNKRIDAACQSAARDVQGFTHRLFYPTIDTRYPDPWRRVRGNVLDLNHEDYELCGSPTLVLDGTTAIEGTDYYLDPETGPFTSIYLMNTSPLAWPLNPLEIAITGPFGASRDTESAGTLGAAANSSVTQVTLSDSSAAGVGDLLLAGTEQMIVTEKEFAATGATVTGTVDNKTNTQTIPVSNGALVNAGETVLIGAEQMFVEIVAGNNLIVKRAQNASTLAAHASTDIVYAPRLATVERGVLGTTAASHSQGDALLRNVPPPLAAEAALALALNNLEQSRSAYARQVGSGDNAREAVGRGVGQIVDDLVQELGRVRIGATR